VLKSLISVCRLMLTLYSYSNFYPNLMLQLIAGLFRCGLGTKLSIYISVYIYVEFTKCIVLIVIVRDIVCLHKVTSRSDSLKFANAVMICVSAPSTTLRYSKNTKEMGYLHWIAICGDGGKSDNVREVDR